MDMFPKKMIKFRPKNVNKQVDAVVGKEKKTINLLRYPYYMIIMVTDLDSFTLTCISYKI